MPAIVLALIFSSLAPLFGLEKPVLAKFENFELWKKGWSDRARAREKAWKDWRAPSNN